METERRFVEASKSQINPLENRLAGILKPVAPRREFVKTLNRRIQTLRPPNLVDRVANLKMVLLVVAGIVSFGLVVLVGIRAFLNLLKRKPIIQA
jgi:hypothetical protein